MLYRAHHHHHYHPFIFTFNPFSQSSLTPSLLLSPSIRDKEMECLQGAFKTGFGSETTTTVSSTVEDFSGVLLNGVTNGVAVNGDDLFVDELFDFSNDVVSHETEEQQQLHEPEVRREPYEEEEEKTCSVFPLVEKKQSVVAEPELSSSGDLTPKEHFGSLPESELSDPVEEGLESLEWLSNFVEDSFSEYSLAGKLPPNTVPNRSERAINSVVQQPCFTTPVQTKARTKRARSGVRVWPILPSSLAAADSSSTSSSSSSNCSTTSFPLFRTTEPARKVQKKKPSDVGAGQQQPRKCSHCGVTKTPQWRAGPLGSKTLCNACGVRFKSGRLLPEYRPACSPTFSSELHSNHHRKVLEMRKKKEFESGPVGLARNF